MLSFKSNGLNRLEELAKNIDKLSKKTEVSFDELFNQEFMSSHTQFTDFVEFVRGGGFVLNSSDDFKAIPDEEFDTYVRSSTDFPDWKEMQLTAARIWTKRQLLK